MYKVIKAFYDLKDATKTKSGNAYHQYMAGDTYPRKGLNPSEERIAELSGRDNKQGTPLIELVEEVSGAGETGKAEAQTNDSGSESKQSEERPKEETIKAQEKKTRGKDAAK